MKREKCPFCNEEILAGALACAHCRERLESDVPDVLHSEKTRCSFCAVNIHADSEMCPHCDENFPDCDIRRNTQMRVVALMCVIYAVSLLAPLFFFGEKVVLLIELFLAALLFLRILIYLKKQLDDRKLGRCLVLYAYLSLSILPLRFIPDWMRNAGFEESVVGYLLGFGFLMSFAAAVFAVSSGVKLVVKDDSHLRFIGLGLFCNAIAIVSTFGMSALMEANEAVFNLGSVLGRLEICINLYVAYHLYKFRIQQ